jgi:hypothetical protein
MPIRDIAQEKAYQLLSDAKELADNACMLWNEPADYLFESSYNLHRKHVDQPIGPEPITTSHVPMPAYYCGRGSFPLLLCNIKCYGVSTDPSSTSNIAFVREVPQD